jgi:hypothetical protein
MVAACEQLLDVAATKSPPGRNPRPCFGALRETPPFSPFPPVKTTLQTLRSGPKVRPYGDSLQERAEESRNGRQPRTFLQEETEKTEGRQASAISAASCKIRSPESTRREPLAHARSHAFGPLAKTPVRNEKQAFSLLQQVQVGVISCQTVLLASARFVAGPFHARPWTARSFPSRVMELLPAAPTGRTSIKLLAMRTPCLTVGSAMWAGRRESCRVFVRFPSGVSSMRDRSEVSIAHRQSPDLFTVD